MTADCQIGNFNIVNSGAIIEHGVAINDHVHIAPGAIILGGCNHRRRELYWGRCDNP